MSSQSALSHIAPLQESGTKMLQEIDVCINFFFCLFVLFGGGVFAVF